MATTEKLITLDDLKTCNESNVYFVFMSLARRLRLTNKRTGSSVERWEAFIMCKSRNEMAAIITGTHPRYLTKELTEDEFNRIWKF